MIALALLSVALAGAPAAEGNAPAPGPAAAPPVAAQPAAGTPAAGKPAATQPAAGMPAASGPAARPQSPASAAAAVIRPLATDKPVRVDADEVRFSWKTRQVVVVGKPLVTLVHDDATLTCRRMTGENDTAGKLKVAVCEGEVRLVRAARVVTCERATYDREAARVVCTGNPVVRDPGGTEARATVLTYDLAADEVRLEGEAQVTMPGDQVDAAAQSSRTPGGKP